MHINLSPIKQSQQEERGSERRQYDCSKLHRWENTLTEQLHDSTCHSNHEKVKKSNRFLAPRIMSPSGTELERRRKNIDRMKHSILMRLQKMSSNGGISYRSEQKKRGHLVSFPTKSARNRKKKPKYETKLSTCENAFRRTRMETNKSTPELSAIAVPRLVLVHETSMNG